MERLRTLSIASALTVAALGLGACGGDSGADDDTVRVSIATGAYGYLPPVVVERAGIMSDKVNIETIPLTNTTAISALVADSVDVVGQGPDLILTAIQQGEDLRIFCRAVTEILVDVVALSDSPLKGVEEGATIEETLQGLSGRSVGLPALGGTTDLQLDTLLQTAGLKPEDITKVPVGTGAAALAALEGDQVDALVTVPFVPQQLTVSGEGKVLMTFSSVDAVNTPLPYAWAAKKSWLDADPQRAEDVCTAFQEAIPFAQDPENRELVDQVMLTEYGISDEATIDTIISDGGVLDTFGDSISCEDVDPVISSLVDRGITTEADRPSCEEILWQP